MKRKWQRPVAIGLTVFVLGILSLRMLHLSADFPNHSRWIDDQAKNTDEGWYMSGALNSAIWGHWHVEGDWSPAVVMPVWPLLIHGVFHFTGVSVVAARAVTVVLSWTVLLMAWWFFRREGDPTLAFCFFLLAGVNSLSYAFGRLAVLEFPLETCAFAAILLSSSIRTGREILLPIALGIMLPLMVLTKTTGVFLVPAVLYPIWFRFRGNLRAAVRPLVIVFVVAAGLYAAEQVLFQSHYTRDVKDFFHYNDARIALDTFRKAIRFFYRGFTWIDPILFPIAVAGLVASWWMRELWRSVVWGTAVWWCVGYAAFIIYHYDGPPRYLGVLELPIIMMAVLFTAAVWKRRPVFGKMLAALCCVAFVWNAEMVIRMAAHPQYTLLRATQQIRALILSHPEASHLMMGHGDAQIELFTGLPAIDDNHGYLTEQQKVERFHPGWLVIWNDEKLSHLAPVLQLRTAALMGEFHAMDEKNRDVIEVYQLLPKTNATAINLTPNPDNAAQPSSR